MKKFFAATLLSAAILGGVSIPANSEAQETVTQAEEAREQVPQGQATVGMVFKGFLFFCGGCFAGVLIYKWQKAKVIETTESANGWELLGLLIISVSLLGLNDLIVDIALGDLADQPVKQILK